MKSISLFVLAIMISIAPMFVKAQTDAPVTSVPMNCYKQWVDYFYQLGSKPVTDGMQEIIISFTSKGSCHCYLGRVQVTGGKIKAPVFVQTQAGEYKTFSELGKKLDPAFLTEVGAGLWDITNGMSVTYHTVDEGYGRLFFYKFLIIDKNMKKEAPSPGELIKK